MDNLLKRGKIITKHDSYFYQRWYEIEEPTVRLEMEMENSELEMEMEDIGSPSGEWDKTIGMINTMKSEKFDE